MNRAFTYCRHSTALQETSTELQTDELRRYWKYQLEPKGIAWVDPFVDPAVSGKIPFLERKAGQALDRVAERGDHILIAKLDRGFRNARDFLTMYELWEKRGIVLHLLDIHCDSSTPIGKMILTVVAAVAEWERKRINDRTHAGYMLGKKKKLERGLPGDISVAPMGFKWAGVRPNRRWVFCPEERAHMAQFLTWHQDGYTLMEMYVKAKKLRMFRRKGRTATLTLGWKKGMPVEWSGPVCYGTTRRPNHKKQCTIQKAIIQEERLQAWEAEGRDVEWIARALLVECLEKRAARIELANEKILVAKALSTSYHNNGNGVVRHPEAD